MDSFLSGSVQSWLAVVVAILGPLTALIVGFEGADWFLRRRLGELDHAPLEGVECKDECHSGPLASGAVPPG